MSAKINHTKIGIFVLLAVALFIAGLLAFGARSYFVPKIKYETAIPGEVSGLSVGSSVQLRGVPIGRVTRIAFGWTIYPNSQLHLIIVEWEAETALVPKLPGLSMPATVRQAVEKGMRATVKGQGITGTSILALERLKPEENPPLAIDFTPRYYYVPSVPSQFTRVLESIEASLSHFQQFDFAGFNQGVSNALHAVSLLSEKLQQLDLQRVTTNANALLIDLKGTSGKLQEAVGQVEEAVKGMKLDAISQNANELVTGIRDTNVKLQAVLDHVGAAPLQQTVTELEQTLENLNSVLIDLKRYPSGFFLGEPPLPARSVQTPQK